MNRPLTAAQLADALGYFSNVAISAMHRNTATEACIAQGIDAVACRLAEIATEDEANAGAVPVGEAVAFRKGDDTLKVDDVHAVYGIDMLTNEPFTHPWWGNRIEVYGEKGGEALRDRILAFLTARFAEEPGIVTRLTRERDAAMDRAEEADRLRVEHAVARDAAEDALAKTRECLEKVEADDQALWLEIGVLLKVTYPIQMTTRAEEAWKRLEACQHARHRSIEAARAALTGDAQEAAK